MDNVLNPIIVGILAFISGYILFILREKHATPKLRYERISSLSLISMDERIGKRIKVTCDGEPTNNIFSFRFGIRNVGKVAIKRFPLSSDSMMKMYKFLT